MVVQAASNVRTTKASRWNVSTRGIVRVRVGMTRGKFVYYRPLVHLLCAETMISDVINFQTCLVWRGPCPSVIVPCVTFSHDSNPLLLLCGNHLHWLLRASTYWWVRSIITSKAVDFANKPRFLLIYPISLVMYVYMYILLNAVLTVFQHENGDVD